VPPPPTWQQQLAGRTLQPRPKRPALQHGRRPRPGAASPLVCLRRFQLQCPPKRWPLLAAQVHAPAPPPLTPPPTSLQPPQVLGHFEDCRLVRRLAISSF
jgi:hypothetical protein